MVQGEDEAQEDERLPRASTPKLFGRVHVAGEVRSHSTGHSENIMANIATQYPV